MLTSVYRTGLQAVVEGGGDGILGTEVWEMEEDVGVGRGWDGIEECCFWLRNGR